jgi:serine/threonine-protein kinase
MANHRRRIGRFEPDALLGQDTAVETYRARDVEALPGEEQQTYVLKVMKPASFDGNAAIASNFTDAVRSFSGIILPGIATPIEIGEAPGPVFAAYPFYEGVDLNVLRKQAAAADRPIDLRVGLLLARKIAERLAPLHNQPDGPRIHGGLAPGNILVAPDGEVWLLDCGLGEAIFARHGFWPSHWQYLSPEQLRGEPATSQSDWYSLGAILYFLYFGRPPYTAPDPLALEATIAAGPPSFEGILPTVASILLRLLGYAEESRPRSSGEVLRRISVALLSLHANVPSPAPPTPVKSEPVPIKTGVETWSPTKEQLQEPSLPEIPDRVRNVASVFEFAPEKGENGEAQPILSGDDPDVGVVYDEEEDEEYEEVGPDGKVHRRTRPRSFRLLSWTKSAFARKIFRYAWIPVVVLLIVGAVAGYFWHRTYQAVRMESERQRLAQSDKMAQLRARGPKMPVVVSLPPGQLQIEVEPSGAVIWVDGAERGTTPMTLATQPGVHRLVVTAMGYRMLRDVVNTQRGVVFKRKMAPTVFPMDGSVSLSIGCNTGGKYPVFVDGREIGVYCPISGIRLEPGKHMAGIFVIPQDRMWTIEREILPDQPQRVLFNH